MRTKAVTGQTEQVLAAGGKSIGKAENMEQNIYDSTVSYILENQNRFYRLESASLQASRPEPEVSGLHFMEVKFFTEFSNFRHKADTGRR